MAPFQPAGQQARWRTLYALLEDRQAGAIVTYQELAAAIEVEPDTAYGRHAVQMAMRRAAKHLLTEQLRAVESVPNVGYRIAEPGGQIELARGHQGKAVRSLERGHDAVTYLDVSALDPDLRRGVELMARAFLAQREAVRALDVRQRRLEAALESVSTQSAATATQAAATAEQVERLRERLDRLETEHQALNPGQDHQ